MKKNPMLRLFNIAAFRSKITLQKAFFFFAQLIVFNLMIASYANGQGTIQWENTIGGALSDFLSSIHQTDDGGYILGGYSKSDISGDKTENSVGENDFWIVKIDSLGNIEWQNTIGGDTTDKLYSCSQTSDGGFILGGMSSSDISGDKSENSMGGSDYWIVKTDAAGNIQWQNTIGGSLDDELNSVQQTSDGGYILGGWSYSNISGDKTENNRDTTLSTYDYWIVKTDQNGNIQWQKTIGGNDWDALFDIQQTSDGGYILGGSSTSGISGEKTEICYNYESDYWIIKTDSLGNIQWQNTIGGDRIDEYGSLDQTSDGGYIVGGYSSSSISVDKTENLVGGMWYDYWILKIDSLGNIQWQNTIGGTDSDILYSIQQDTDGGFLLGGSSHSYISGDKTEVNNIYDYWIVKTDSIGNIEWQNTIGGNGMDDQLHFLQTDDGNYILGGYSNSQICGDKSENCIGGADFWIVKIADKSNFINGSAFADLNTNSIKDNGEPDLPFNKATEQNTGRFSFTEQNGHYSVSVLDTGNFVITPTAINYFNAVPATHSANFSSIHQTDSLNNFAFQPQGVYNDVCITITPLSAFRSGFNSSYMIKYQNYGTTIIAPTVLFFPDSNITYITASVIPSSISADSIAWLLPALSPFQSGDIRVTVNVNTGLSIGSLINSFVRIEPIAGDINPACNYHSWEVYTIGSYDPNDILVNEDTLTTTELAASPWLDYIIRFQNTGNDTAFNVKILNPIDTSRLEISSLEIVNASHGVNVRWIPLENNMEFKFDNIFLPDSIVNEPMSHGFVHYRIKPRTTLIAGNLIHNNAAIYFDFNFPVLTNDAVTKIVLTTKINDIPDYNSLFVAFPSPVYDKLRIESKELKISSIAIYNLWGEKIFSQSSALNEQRTDIDISSQPPGVYFINILTEHKEQFTTRFIKL
jgi:hypothetical protein